MPRFVRKFERGFVDPLSLFGLLFLVVTLGVLTYVTANPNIRQLIGSSAKFIENGVSLSTKKNSDTAVVNVKNKNKGKNEDDQDSNPTPAETPVAPVIPTTDTGQTTGPKPGEFGYVYPNQLDSGQPFIAGTYIGPNGKRYLVATAGTAAAAFEYYKSNPDKISSANFSDSTKKELNLDAILQASNQTQTAPTTPTTTMTIQEIQEFKLECTGNGGTYNSTTKTCTPKSTTTSGSTQASTPLTAQDKKIASQDCASAGGTYYSTYNSCIKTSSTQTVKETNEGLTTFTTTSYIDVNTGKVIQKIDSSAPTADASNRGSYNPLKKAEGEACNFASDCGSGKCERQGASYINRCVPAEDKPLVVQAINFLDAITFDKFSAYGNAYQSDYQVWQEQGFSSSDEYVRDCVSKTNTANAYNCFRQGTALSKKAAIATIDLGTTVTAEGAVIAALPAAAAAGSGGALFTTALTTYSGISTLQQTSSALVAQIEDPGFFREDIAVNSFLEAIDPKTYLTDAGNQTAMAALSWANLGTADKLVRTFGALETAAKAGQATEALVSAAQSARNLNNAVSLINLGIDLPNAINTCGQEGFLTRNCGSAAGAAVLDIAFGALDYHQGQLGFGDPLAKIKAPLGPIYGPVQDVPDPNETRIASPAQLEQINQLQPNVGGDTLTFSNIGGETKFTPSTQLSMFDSLSSGPKVDMLSVPLSVPTANVSTIVGNANQLLFPETQPSRDPKADFGLGEPDPNQTKLVAQFDLDADKTTIGQLLPSDLDNQIPTTPEKGVETPFTASNPNPAKPASELTVPVVDDALIKKIADKLPNDGASPQYLVDKLKAEGIPEDNITAADLDKINQLAKDRPLNVPDFAKPKAPDTNIAEPIKAPQNNLADLPTIPNDKPTSATTWLKEKVTDPLFGFLTGNPLPKTLDTASIAKPKPLLERLFGEAKNTEFSTIKVGDQITLKPGDIVKTGEFGSTIPDPKDYPDGIFWRTDDPNSIPQKMTNDGITLQKTNSAQNIQFVDANGNTINGFTGGGNAITLTDEISVKTAITHANPEPGVLSLSGITKVWDDNVVKPLGNLLFGNPLPKSLDTGNLADVTRGSFNDIPFSLRPEPASELVAKVSETTHPKIMDDLIEYRRSHGGSTDGMASEYNGRMWSVDYNKTAKGFEEFKNAGGNPDELVRKIDSGVRGGNENFLFSVKERGSVRDHISYPDLTSDRTTSFNRMTTFLDNDARLIISQELAKVGITKAPEDIVLSDYFWASVGPETKIKITKVGDALIQEVGKPIEGTLLSYIGDQVPPSKTGGDYYNILEYREGGSPDVSYFYEPKKTNLTANVLKKGDPVLSGPVEPKYTRRVIPTADEVNSLASTVNFDTSLTPKDIAKLIGPEQGAKIGIEPVDVPLADTPFVQIKTEVGDGKIEIPLGQKIDQIAADATGFSVVTTEAQARFGNNSPEVVGIQELRNRYFAQIVEGAANNKGRTVRFAGDGAEIVFLEGLTPKALAELVELNKSFKKNIANALKGLEGYSEAEQAAAKFLNENFKDQFFVKVAGISSDATLTVHESNGLGYKPIEITTKINADDYLKYSKKYKFENGVDSTVISVSPELVAKFKPAELKKAGLYVITDPKYGTFIGLLDEKPSIFQDIWSSVKKFFASPISEKGGAINANKLAESSANAINKTNPTALTKIQDWYSANIRDEQGLFPSVRKSLNPKSEIETIVNRAEKALIAGGNSKDVGCRAGICTTVSTLVTEDASRNGVRSLNYNVASINYNRGVDPSNSIFHDFSIMTDSKGNNYIVDLTLNQFKDIDFTNPVAKTLLEKGYIPLTESNLNEYLNLGTKGPKTTVKIDILNKTNTNLNSAGLAEIRDYFDQKYIGGENDLKTNAENDVYTKAYERLIAKGYPSDEIDSLLGDSLFNGGADKIANDAPPSRVDPNINNIKVPSEKPRPSLFGIELKNIRDENGKLQFPIGTVKSPGINLPKLSKAPEIYGQRLEKLGTAAPWTDQGKIDALTVYHGSDKPLSVKVDFAGDPLSNGSYTLGEGLYTSLNQSTGEYYKELRASQTNTTGFLNELKVYDADVLDLRLSDGKNKPLPKELVQDWLNYIESIKSDRVPTGSTIYDRAMQDRWSKYINRITSLLTTDGDLDLKNVLWTSGEGSVGSPPWTSDFRDFMISKNVDGLAYFEGIDYKPDASDPTLVIYNYNKIGTQEDWSQRAIENNFPNPKPQPNSSFFGLEWKGVTDENGKFQLPIDLGIKFNNFKNSDGKFTLWPFEKKTIPNISDIQGPSRSDANSPLIVSELVTSPPTKPYELITPPQNTKTWVDDLPIPKLSGDRVGDVQDTGELLERYASHWDGQYNNETHELVLKPKQTSTTLQNGTEYYDSNLATVENGVIKPLPNSGYTPLKYDEFGHIVLPDDELPSISGDNKLIFRGINYEGMQTALKDGTLNSGPLMKSWGATDKIYFAPNARRAFSYGAQGEGVYAMATFENPSYVIVLKEPANSTIDSFGDTIIYRPVSLDEIEKIYEIKPYYIKSGAIPHVVDIRTVPGVDVAKMIELGQEPFMSLPDIFTQINKGPKGRFAYKEISLTEVEEVFGIKAPKPEPNSSDIIIPKNENLNGNTSQQKSFFGLEWKGVTDENGKLQLPIDLGIKFNNFKNSDGKFTLWPFEKTITKPNNINGNISPELANTIKSLISTPNAEVTIDTVNGIVTRNPKPRSGIQSFDPTNYDKYLDFEFTRPKEFYKKYGGQNGIPKYLGDTPEGGFKLTYVPGAPISEFKGTLTIQEIDTAINKLKLQMENTGYAHGDLNPTNILVDTLPDGSHEINFVDYTGNTKGQTEKDFDLEILKENLDKHLQNKTTIFGVELNGIRDKNGKLQLPIDLGIKFNNFKNSDGKFTLWPFEKAKIIEPNQTSVAIKNSDSIVKFDKNDNFFHAGIKAGNTEDISDGYIRINAIIDNKGEIVDFGNHNISKSIVEGLEMGDLKEIKIQQKVGDVEGPNYKIIYDDNASVEIKTNLTRLESKLNDIQQKIVIKPEIGSNNNPVNKLAEKFYSSIPERGGGIKITPDTVENAKFVVWFAKNTAKVTAGMLGITEIIMNRDTIVNFVLSTGRHGYYSPNLNTYVYYQDGKWYRTDTNEEVENGLYISYLQKNDFRSIGWGALVQHLTINESTFNSPEWKKFENGVINDTSANPYDINKITTAVYNNMTYFPAKDAYSVNYDPFVSYVSTLYTMFTNQSLQYKMAKNFTVCFEFAAAEQAYLAKIGVNSQLVTGYMNYEEISIGHAFLMITDKDNNKWIADPTNNIVIPYDDYIKLLNITNIKVVPSMYGFASQTEDPILTINSTTTTQNIGNPAPTNWLTKIVNSVVGFFGSILNDQKASTPQPYVQTDSTINTHPRPVIPTPSPESIAPKVLEEPLPFSQSHSFGEPYGLTERPSLKGTGQCQIYSGRCDGTRMYELYQWYKSKPDGWWYHNGEFTPADFLALILTAEAKGNRNPETLKAMAEATSNQLWGSGENHEAYCKTPDCQGGAGIFNFLGAYVQSAEVRYNAINNYGKISEGSLDLDKEWVDYFEENGVSIEDLANDMVYDPVSKTWNNNVPTQWGAPSGNDPFTKWLNKALEANAPIGTTDGNGIYSVGGADAVYTLNQAACWSTGAGCHSTTP